MKVIRFGRDVCVQFLNNCSHTVLVYNIQYMATKFAGTDWDRTDVSVHFTTIAVRNIGELSLAKRAAICHHL